MKNLVWIILIKFLFLKGVHLQVTQTNLTTTTINIKLDNSTTSGFEKRPSIVIEHNTTQDSTIPTDVYEIFRETIDILNNETVIGALNKTLKTNYTIIAEAIELSETRKNYRLEKTAAVAAGVFLVTAIVAYTSCVGYRRYLQRKYGDKQRLAQEDIYYTPDLHSFGK